MERILIAEDSATQRESLRHMLAKQGYEVISAADGEEAWSRLAEARPTIVITDIIMPRRDGYTLCRDIKSDARFSAIPVVLLTSLSHRKDVIAALECGADGFIGKPFAEDHLLSRLRSVINNRELAARDKPEAGFEISDGEGTHLITAGRRQMLDLLLSVYEVAMRRNEELARAQGSLRTLNADLERKVRDRTVKLEESNKALETFCYSVAHDLRSPLRSIQGYVSLLGEEYASRLDEQAVRYADRACAAAGRMDHMILDLLAYGRVSHADTQLERLDLADEIEKAVSTFAHEIEDKNARVVVEARDVRLHAGRVLLGQILNNLLGNALKFTREGEPPRIEIRAGVEKNDVIITVRDHGIGIDPAYQAKIFNLFEKLETRGASGTGIGLAIVRKAVERLNGQITVHSSPGQGSCFTLVFAGAAA